jgi:hypothetical protein
MAMPVTSTITTPCPNLFAAELDLNQGGSHPLVFAQNEGLIVRGPTTVFGAAGTANLVVDLAWAEVTSY